MNIFQLCSASTLFLGSLCLSEKNEMIKTLDMKIPKGPETMPIAVAVDLSLSPNQLLANLVTGFLRKA
jgi:hypothetical protein